jgi:hypothetical protein
MCCKVLPRHLEVQLNQVLGISLASKVWTMTFELSYCWFFPIFKRFGIFCFNSHLDMAWLGFIICSYIINNMIFKYHKFRHFVVMVLIIDVLFVGPLISYSFTFGCVTQVGNVLNIIILWHLRVTTWGGRRRFKHAWTITKHLEFKEPPHVVR